MLVVQSLSRILCPRIAPIQSILSILLMTSAFVLDPVSFRLNFFANNFCCFNVISLKRAINVASSLSLRSLQLLRSVSTSLFVSAIKPCQSMLQASAISAVSVSHGNHPYTYIYIYIYIHTHTVHLKCNLMLARV